MSEGNKSKDNTSSTSTTQTTTQLPGIQNNLVIPSSPKLIKENSQVAEKKSTITEEEK